MKQPTTQQKRFLREQGQTSISRISKSWIEALKAADAFPMSRTGESGGRRSSDASDPTGNAAMRFDVAAKWISEVRRLLPGFTPAHRHQYDRSVSRMIDRWPPAASKVLDELVRLANVAAKEWPDTPRRGQMVDGVKVGEKTPTVETCVECKGPISGGALDPIARIDGKPFHRKPCYQTVWQRNKRAERRLHRVDI